MAKIKKASASYASSTGVELQNMFLDHCKAVYEKDHNEFKDVTGTFLVLVIGLNGLTKAEAHKNIDNISEDIRSHIHEIIDIGLSVYIDWCMAHPITADLES